MTDSHVQQQFSEAFDGDLKDKDRVAFDAHLAACAACADRWREFRTVLDAVHSLPVARMPRPVVLPAAPPLAPGREGLLGRLRARAGGPTIAIAAMLAAVMVLAVGIGVNRLRQPAVGTPVAARGDGGSAKAGAAPAITSPGQVRAPDGPAVGSPGALGTAGCGQSLAAVGPPPAPPAGFSNAASRSDSGRSLILAVTARRYAPGEAILIYARAADASSLSLPCVTLTQGAAHQVPQSAAQNGVKQLALPTSTIIDGAPALTVGVPSTAAPGSTYQLTAALPAPDGHVPLTVSLTITVG
ncbi:MAG: zf-HC2 domain-containing protein [Candidatus Dormibacteria bacterium]